jgi:hypothetical protein
VTPDADREAGGRVAGISVVVVHVETEPYRVTAGLKGRAAILEIPFDLVCDSYDFPRGG